MWNPPGPAFLFCPADRPDRYEKAAAVADVVILDLEDAVAPDNKAAARAALQTTLLDPNRTVVRVNPAGSAEQELDLEALASTPYLTVMLAKAESAEQVAALAPREVIAICETPRGVLAAADIAESGATAAMTWGAEDLVAALGGRSSRGTDRGYYGVARHARAHVLLAAGACRVPVFDAVHLDIADLDGLRAEALDAAASGFAGTMCIHPSQVPVVREAYRPTEREVQWAHRVLESAKGAPGVFSFEGQMVDAAVFRQAQQIVNRAGESG